MIKFKHPDPKLNRKQEEMVAAAPADQRRFHKLLFTYGNITYCYHARAKDFKPTLEDWKEWLEGLPENVRRDMEKEGFEQGKRTLSFTRYVMEKNDDLSNERNKE